MSKPASGDRKGGRIVSSAHLAEGGAPALSEFEYGLIISGNAFERWIVRCMAAAGYPDLSALDVLVVHSVNHRARDKRLADICFVLNIEESHLVSYALKKLVRARLVEAEKRGKEAVFRTTGEGAEACARYRAVREPCLVETVRALGNFDEAEIASVARFLRALSGLYDQAARAATSL
ncbi:MAG: winged helix DNA-binding protein [Alphaproteobacteria bacterium]|nr:winged helix DNA-binding protein [Alphaproteobacteria bacterium]